MCTVLQTPLRVIDLMANSKREVERFKKKAVRETKVSVSDLLEDSKTPEQREDEAESMVKKLLRNMKDEED